MYIPNFTVHGKNICFGLSNATGLYGYVYDFSVGYKAISTSKIHDIHRYLMKKKQYCMKYLVL